MSEDVASEGGKALESHQQVGYRKPPAQHRFRKGQSGNPKGRPKKPRPTTVNTDFGMRPAEEFLRVEAYRSVTIREGERIIELPAIQAVFRAMGVSAMKGNRFAQRTLAELVTQMESQEHQSRMELFGTAIDYKQWWEAEIEHCKAAGLPEPTPTPHPDDIILDPDIGEVRILGPKTREQKEHFDRAIANRDDTQQEISDYAERYRRARDSGKKAMWLDLWHREQRFFDLINDNLPVRYRTELRDRSWKEGASRPGSHKKANWPE